MPNTHQNQLSEFRIRYGFHSRKYCPSLCSKTVQIDAPPTFLPSPIHSRISPREPGHPGPDGPPVERPGGYWIRSFRCATERVSTTKGESLPLPGDGAAKSPGTGKRNLPKPFFFQFCRLDSGFQIRHISCELAKTMKKSFILLLLAGAVSAASAASLKINLGSSSAGDPDWISVCLLYTSPSPRD